MHLTLQMLQVTSPFAATSDDAAAHLTMGICHECLKVLSEIDDTFLANTELSFRWYQLIE